MVLSQCISSNAARLDMLDPIPRHEEEAGEYSGIEAVTQGNTAPSTSPVQEFGSLFDARIRQILENPNFLEPPTEGLEPPVKRPWKPARELQTELGAVDAEQLSVQTGRVKTGQPDTPSSGNRCKCKQSQCVKLYCKCFRSQNFCKDCACVGCFNMSDNDIRRSVIKTLSNRNLLNFPTPFSSRSVSLTDPAKALKQTAYAGVKPLILGSRGCNCRNSRCQKKYCECFLSGVGCGTHCKCSNCLNKGRRELSDRQGEENEPDYAKLKEELLAKLTSIKRVKFKTSV